MGGGSVKNVYLYRATSTTILAPIPFNIKILYELIYMYIDLTNLNKRAKPPLKSCVQINNLSFPDQST